MARLETVRGLVLSGLRSPALVDTVALVGGSFAAQVIFFLAAPLITKLFPPEALGLLAATLSVALLSRQVASLNYHQAIPVVRNDSTAKRLATLTLTLSLIFAGVTCLLMLVGGAVAFAGPFKDWLNAMWWVLPLMLVALCTNDVIAYSITRSGPLRALGEARLGQGSAYVASLVAAGLLLPLASMLCLAHAIGFGVANAWLLFRRRGQPIWRACSPAQLISLAKRFQRYPRYIMPSNLMAQGGIELPSLIIASFYGLREAGLFFLTVRVIGLFNQMLGESATWVTLARMAEMARSDPVKLRIFTFRFATLGVFLGGPIVIGLAAVAAWLAPTILGSEYHEVGWIIMMVSLSLPFQIFLLPFAPLTILGAEALQMRTHVGRLAIILTCVGTPSLLGLSFPWVVGGYALGMSLVYILVFVVWVGALPPDPRKAPYTVDGKLGKS